MDYVLTVIISPLPASESSWYLDATKRWKTACLKFSWKVWKKEEEGNDIPLSQRLKPIESRQGRRGL